jgi:hypothetical protein
VATLVGSHNVEHYFVATQDVDLRKRLRKVCIFAGSLVFFEVCIIRNGLSELCRRDCTCLFVYFYIHHMSCHKD